MIAFCFHFILIICGEWSFRRRGQQTRPHNFDQSILDSLVPSVCLAPAPELGDRLAAKMMGLGVLANLSTISSFSGIFRIAPPITISEGDLELGLGIMEQSFSCTKAVCYSISEGIGLLTF
jgi:hypothetical protein